MSPGAARQVWSMANLPRDYAKDVPASNPEGREKFAGDLISDILLTFPKLDSIFRSYTSDAEALNTAETNERHAREDAKRLRGELGKVQRESDEKALKILALEKDLGNARTESGEWKRKAEGLEEELEIAREETAERRRAIIDEFKGSPEYTDAIAAGGVAGLMEIVGSIAAELSARVPAVDPYSLDSMKEMLPPAQGDGSSSP